MKMSNIDIKSTKFDLGRGIVHIDDLPVEIFLDTIKNINTFSITEKVDGSALWFGLDRNGNFYTSRSHKGGQEYFTSKEWGDRFADSPFKSAHAALEQKIEIFKKYLTSGDIIEIEVLYGQKPNAIQYNANQIIFLRPIVGNPDLNSLSKELDGKIVEIFVDKLPITNDGRIINYISKNQTWSFANVHEYTIDFNNLNNLLGDKIKLLEEFLKSPNIVNLTIDNIRPTNIEIYKMRKSPKNSQAKTVINNVISNFYGEIKNILLDNLVRNKNSLLGPKDGWIEGVVLKREANGRTEQIKIVDKDVFTAVNKFNHQVRNYILRKHHGTESPRDQVGIRGNFLRDLSTIIGCPQLGTIQAKKYLKNNKISLYEIDEIRKDLLILINQNIELLETTLNDYNQQRNNKSFIDSLGRIHKYDTVIHERTLQVFAETFNEFNQWTEIIRDAKSTDDILVTLAI